MILVYLLVILLLGVYSYSQIDLNLTLLQTSWFLEFKNVVVNLGYYNRPLSAAIFLALILALFASYLYLLKKAEKLSSRTIIIGLGGIALVGIISYPAFSYDFFNYLFDARIVSTYGQNPYLVSPQQFEGDLWLRFMHWVHRTYPYGPGWLVATVPLSFVGAGKFIFTAALFKLGFIANYFVGVYLVWLITKNKKLVVLYAFNPLVVIESVVSPHLDALMATLLLVSYWYYQRNKLVFSVVFNLLSVSIKFITIVSLPFLFWKWPLDKVAKCTIAALALVLTYVIVQREFYPWYLLPLFASAAILTKSKYLRPLLVALSLGLLLQYTPFIYLGIYSFEEKIAKMALLVLPIVFYLPLAKKLAR